MSLTVQSVLKDSESKLREAKLSPDEAAILIASLLGVKKAELFSHPEREISPVQYIEIKKSLAKRLTGYSVAAILGHKEFYGLDFVVNEDTLIPRPETELLVDAALGYLKKADHQSVLDMGTGSGCIIIALAKNLPQQTRSRFFGADISEKALAVARQNAKKHHAAVHFFRSNLFDKAGDQKYTLILANLPYLTTKQLHEPSIKREPVGALWGGSDGLDIYREFFKQAQTHVAEHFSIGIEIDPSQSDEIQKIAQAIFPEATVTITKDLAGQDRLVSLCSA